MDASLQLEHIKRLESNVDLVQTSFSVLVVVHTTM